MINYNGDQDKTSVTATPGRQAAHPSGELVDRLHLSIYRLSRLLRQQSLEGLSAAQASVLGTVSRLGDPTLGELAAVEQVQPPTITRIVTSLTDAGMVTRLSDVADRRSARVRITRAGERSLERIRKRKDAYLTHRLAELGPDEQAHVANLVALLEHLAEPLV